MAERNKVAVCIATYKRPNGLLRLLESLQKLSFKKVHPPEWNVVVVENDVEATCQAIVLDFACKSSIPISYGIEPKQGIASARNTAVHMAGEVDFIAFIDDDEIAEIYWLDELLFAQGLYSVDIVKGPVIPRFDLSIDSWVKRGRFFERARFTTGTLLPYKYLATNNVLVKAKWLQEVENPFDERFNLTGGSDTLFFAEVIKMGAKAIWVDDALVYEINPESRVSVRWLLQRAYRLGNILARVEIIVDSPTVIAIRIIKSIGNIFASIVLLIPLSLTFGYAGLIKCLLYSARGFGQICGLTGITYKEYKTIHGN